MLDQTEQVLLGGEMQGSISPLPSIDFNTKSVHSCSGDISFANSLIIFRNAPLNDPLTFIPKTIEKIKCLHEVQ